MADSDPKSDTYSHEETVERREATLKRMLATPHKPHKAKNPASPKAGRDGSEKKPD